MGKNNPKIENGDCVIVRFKVISIKANLKYNRSATFIKAGPNGELLEVAKYGAYYDGKHQQTQALSYAGKCLEGDYFTVHGVATKATQTIIEVQIDKNGTTIIADADNVTLIT